jgi:hypothetical protein
MKECECCKGKERVGSIWWGITCGAWAVLFFFSFLCVDIVTTNFFFWAIDFLFFYYFSPRLTLFSFSLRICESNALRKSLVLNQRSRLV